MSKQRLLTEILRPKRIEQLILPKRIREVIGDGELKQNYLFYGGPGQGKTSAAKVLASKHPYKYINCSDETSVEVVRETINKFCSTISVMDGEESFKVIILDEVEGVSEQFFKALRGTIEKFAEQARFIATTNYVNKIPEAILSRFSVINFDFVDSEEESEIFNSIKERASIVLTKLGIEAEEKALNELVKRSFPDMRKLFNKIQTIQISGTKKLTQEDILKTEWSFEDVFKLCVSAPDPYNNYIFLVGQYSSRVDDVLASLGEEFPRWLNEKYPGKTSLLPQIIYEIALHQAQRIQVIDSTISMLSCVFKLQALLATK
jgi:DNA polymerase III delta prime subunit